MQLLHTVNLSSMADSDNAGTARRHLPGTPVGQLFQKPLHTPPPQHDEDERKRMKKAGESFFAPGRLNFEVVDGPNPSTVAHNSPSEGGTVAAEPVTPPGAKMTASSGSGSRERDDPLL